MSSLIKLLLFLEIFFLIKAERKEPEEPDYCKYNDTSLKEVIVNEDVTDPDTCFLYSDSEPCCSYKDNNNNNKCVTKSYIKNNEIKNYECPVETPIKNNCGLAGIYTPKSDTQCTEISLVEAYCCFVTVSKGNAIYNACLRSKKFVDQKKKKNKDEIEKTVRGYGDDYKVVNITCYGEWNVYSIFFYSLLIFILF